MTITGTTKTLLDLDGGIRFRQWRVFALGLDTLDDRYLIDKSRLAETRPGDPSLADWPVHMAIKNWIDIEDFIQAWRAAVLIHSIPLGKIDIERSIELARKHGRRTERNTAKAIDRLERQDAHERRSSTEPLT